MPRMQPPKGYLRSKEVQEILNISPAMVREYVDRKKIKHLVPPGRTHGFYLESDVRKLANELDVFLKLEEETKTTDFVMATPTDIPGCIKLNRELFAVKDSASDAVLSEKWTSWIHKNPEVVYVLKADEDVVGIITTLPFKPNSEKFEEILHGDTSILLGDVDITTEDVEEYKKGNHVQLYVAEIGIKPSLDRDLRHKYGAKLISKFMDTIVDLGRKGVIIDHMTAVGATNRGVKLLQHFGFSEVLFPRQDTRLFTINMEISGAPIIQAYRKALEESRSA